MSTIGPEADALLKTGQPAAGAAQPPDAGQPTPGAGEPGQAQPGVPAGFVPIAAMQGEQANTKAARDQAARLESWAQRVREKARAAGLEVTDDGEVYRAPPSGPPDLAPELVNDSDVQAAAGGYATPEQWVRAQQKIMQHAAGPVLAPVMSTQAQLNLQLLGPKYPDLEVPEVRQGVDAELAQLAAAFPGRTLPVEQIVQRHIGLNLDKVIAARQNRQVTVTTTGGSRFTQGARPGPETPTPAPLSEAAAEFARKQGIDQKVLDRVQQRRAEEGRGR